MNPKTPIISVVVPTFNHAHFLGRCLDSIREQTLSNWEVLVVNNFSTDNTEDVVAAYKDPRIKLINFSNNGIIAASRNEGVRQAVGEYLAFLDSDDWWYPQKLEVSVKALLNADLVYHDMDVFTPKGKIPFWKARGRRLNGNVFIDLLTKGNALINSSVVTKRSIITAVGGLSEDKELVAGEDYDLWLKISRKTEKFCHIPKFLGAYWVGPENFSKNNAVVKAKSKALKNKYYPYLTPIQRENFDSHLNYGIGRVLMDLGEEREALEMFESGLTSSNSIIRFRSRFFRSALVVKGFKYVIGGGQREVNKKSVSGTRKKKVLHVITDLDFGGAEMMLVKLLSSMDRVNFEPVVISLTARGKLAPRIEQLGIPVFSLGMRSIDLVPLYIQPIVLIAGFFKLMKHLRNMSPDVIQAWLLHANFLGQLCSFCMFKKVPVIWNMRHGNIMHDRSQKFSTRILVRILSYLAQYPAKIIYNSLVSLKEHERIGFAKGKNKVIANGFETDIFVSAPKEGLKIRKQLAIPEDSFVVGMVGRYDPLKDHGNFISAAEIFLKSVDKDAHFILVGKGITPGNNALMQLIEKAGIRSRLHLLGSRDDIARIYSTFDVFSCSSYSEGFPNVIGEAMSSSVPCVATDAGDTTWIIGDTGVVVPVRNPQALADGWVKYYHMDKKQRQEQGTKARKRIENLFHISGIAKLYENEYHKVMPFSQHSLELSFNGRKH